MGVVGTGYTKLILFGEHAAVYGYPAIGMPLPWTVTVSLTQTETLRWAPLRDPKHAKKLDTLLHQIPEVFPEVSLKQPFEIKIHAEAPIGIGLGSSGALCVALAQSLFAYLGRENQFNEDHERLLAVWQSAHKFEKTFHDSPSGIDTGLATYGKFCYFKTIGKELPQCHFIEERKIPLVLAALPRESDTASLVSNLKTQKQKNKNFEILIAELGNLADDAIQCFLHPSKNFLQTVGLLANEGQKHLSALHLSSPDCNDMLAYGLSIGALGGKISGAGGGGAYFLIAEDEFQADEIAANMRDFALRNEIHHVLSPTSLHSL